MTTRTFDLSEVPDVVEYEPIPRGNYLANITEIEETTVKNEQSKNFGKPQARIVLTISDGNYQGRLLFYYALLEGEANQLRNLKNLFIACGYKREAIESGSFSVDWEDILNQNIGVSVTIRDWNETKTNNVQRLMPASEVASASISDLLP